MKKGILCAAAILLLFLPGCSGGGSAKAADVQKVAEGLISSVKFKDQMSELSRETAVKLYGIDSGDVVKAAVYESTGATAEEVAAFEAKDEQAAGRIQAKAKQRIEDQKAGFQDYQPAEMAKLKDPVLVEKGKYVVLCVSDENGTAKKTIDSFLS
jgi:PBP1b-binding outer membrane lipoprotein LpoB